MSLTGQAKKDYQKEYMRKKRSNIFLVRPVRPTPKAPLDFVRPLESHFKPYPKSKSTFDAGKPKTTLTPVVKRKLEKTGLVLNGNRISLAPQSESRGIKEEVDTLLPPKEEEL